MTLWRLVSGAVILRHSLVIGAVIVAIAHAAVAQDRKPAADCGGPQARAFDFWVGRWDIRQRILRADGGWHEFPASTEVSRALDGCALVEHWSGRVQFFWEGMQRPEPMTGLSVRAYDPAAGTSGTWRIHWMDSRSPRFGEPYVGRFDSGVGVFTRHWSTPNGPRTGRITFSAITDTTVHWRLETSPDSGASWQTIWIMEMYRRRER